MVVAGRFKHIVQPLLRAFSLQANFYGSVALTVLENSTEKLAKINEQDNMENTFLSARFPFIKTLYVLAKRNKKDYNLSKHFVIKEIFPLYALT